jgi:protein subunit release factor A
VRIVHNPTGIVVQCQAERSQHSNKDKCMKMLKAKLYELELDKKRQEMEKFYGDKGDIAWGRQIRSYVLQPYTMVKDHRTGVQTGNVQAVLDGELDAVRRGLPEESRAMSVLSEILTNKRAEVAARQAVHPLAELARARPGRRIALTSWPPCAGRPSR